MEKVFERCDEKRRKLAMALILEKYSGDVRLDPVWILIEHEFGNFVIQTFYKLSDFDTKKAISDKVGEY